MCERKLESTVSKRLRISELNPHLLCALCGGYLIDATTIIECLHAFCKTCILRYLETSNYCPICEVLIHKTRPWQNIRLDHSLQNAVYKMVPGLFQTLLCAMGDMHILSGAPHIMARSVIDQDEMRRRREFYQKQNQTEKRSLTTSQSSQGELGDRIIFSQDEEFSISIEFSPDGKPVPDITNTATKRQKCLYHQDKRYLKCPAALRIEHLKKFIRAKFSLPQNIQIDLFREKEPLCDTYSLMDVAYIYHWKRDCVLRLFYSFYEVPPKVRKVEALLSVTEKVGKKNKEKEKKDEKTEKRKEERKLKCKKEKSKERKQCQVSGKTDDSGGQVNANIASPKLGKADDSGGQVNANIASPKLGKADDSGGQVNANIASPKLGKADDSRGQVNANIASPKLGKADDSRVQVNANIASPKPADAQKNVKLSNNVKTLLKRKHPDSECVNKNVQSIKHEKTCVRSRLADSGQQTEPYQPPPVKQENPCVKNHEADSEQHCQPPPAKQKCLPQAATYSIVTACDSKAKNKTSKESAAAVKSSLKLLIKSSDLKAPTIQNGPSSVKDKKHKTSGTPSLSLKSNLFERMGSFAKYPFSEHFDSSAAPTHVISSPSQRGKSPLNSNKTNIKDIKYDQRQVSDDSDMLKPVKDWSDTGSPAKIEKKPSLIGNKIVKTKDSSVGSFCTQNGVDVFGDAREYKKIEPVTKVLDTKVQSLGIRSDSGAGDREQESREVKSEPVASSLDTGPGVHKESSEPVANHLSSDSALHIVDTEPMEHREQSDNGSCPSGQNDLKKLLPEACVVEPAANGEPAPAGAVKPGVTGLETSGKCKSQEKPVVETKSVDGKLEENNAQKASDVNETDIKTAGKLNIPVNKTAHCANQTSSGPIRHSLDLKPASQDASRHSDKKLSNEVQSKQSTVSDAQKSVIFSKCNVPETKDVKHLEHPSETKSRASSEVENVPIAIPTVKFFSLKPKIFDRSLSKGEKDQKSKSELSTIFKEKSVNQLKLANGKFDGEKSTASDGSSQDNNVIASCVQGQSSVLSTTVQKLSPPKIEPCSTMDEKSSYISKTTTDTCTPLPAPPKLLKTAMASTSSSNSIVVSHSIASIVFSPNTSSRSSILYPVGVHLTAATSVIASTTNTASVSLSGSASSAVSSKSVTSLSFSSSTATKPSPIATPLTSVSPHSTLKATDLSKPSGKPQNQPQGESHLVKPTEKSPTSPSAVPHSSSIKVSLPSNGSVSNGSVHPVANQVTNPGTKSLSYTDSIKTNVISDIPATIDNTFLITPPEEKKSPVLVHRTSPNITQAPNTSVEVPKEAANLDNFLFDTKPSEKDILIAKMSPEFKEMASSLKQSQKNAARTRVSATEAQNVLNEKSLKKPEPQITAIHNLPKTISQTSKYSVTRSVIMSTSSNTRTNSSVIQTTKISTLIPKSNSVTSRSGMYSKGFSYPASINNVPSSRSFLHTSLLPHVSRSITTLMNGGADYERAMTTKTTGMISHSGTKISSPIAAQQKPISQQKPVSQQKPISQQKVTSSSKHSSKVSEVKAEKAQKVKSIPPLTIPKANFVSTTLKLQRSPGSTDHYIFAPLSHYSSTGHHNGEHRHKTKEKHNGSRTPTSPPTANKDSVFAGERQRVPTIKISDINRNPIIVESGSSHLSPYRSYCHGGSRSATLENGTNRAHTRGGSESSSPNGGNDRSSARDSRRPSDSELLVNQHWHGYPTADLLFNGFKLPSHAKFHDLHYDTDAMPLDYSQSSSKS